MPGRLCGETVDADGNRGFVLTLSTREQHIRREKATSEHLHQLGLCALAFSIHMSLLGEAGLKKLARLNHHNAVRLARMLGTVPGVEAAQQELLQRDDHPAGRSRLRRWSRCWPRPACSPACRSAASSPTIRPSRT